MSASQSRPPAAPGSSAPANAAPRPGQGGRCEGRACQVRRSHPGPLTSAQVRRADAAPSCPPARSGLPPAPSPDQVKREIPLCGRAQRSGSLRLEAGGGQPLLLCLEPASPAPRRLLSGIPPPALREAVERETEGAAGRSEGSAGGAGRSPPASAWVTPLCPPLLGQEPAGCRAAPPGQALAALKSRPLLIREWQGSNFAPRLMPALRPQSWAESFLNR